MIVVDVVAGVAAGVGVVDVRGAVVDADDAAAAAAPDEGVVDAVVALAAAAAADAVQRRSWCPRTQDWLLAGTLIAIRAHPSSVVRVPGRLPV